MEPKIRVAREADIPMYVEVAQEAQDFLRSKGLAQWVPAAHPEFLPNLVAKVERRSLRKVCCGTEALAFFDLSLDPSEWWLERAGRAGYLSGIVVARRNRRRGVGSFILKHAEAKVRDSGGRYLRLDCHAGNEWLCAWYRAKGFTEVARIEQHPGYIGVLFQKLVAAGAPNSRV